MIIKDKKYLNLILLLTILFFSFQNCSDIHLSKMKVSSVPIPIAPEPEIEVIEDVEIPQGEPEGDGPEVIEFEGLPNDSCDIEKESLSEIQKSLFQPEGYDMALFRWEEVFGKPYPEAGGPPTMIGSFNLNRKTMRNKYISIMIAENSPNSIRNMLSWFSSASTQQTEPPTNGYIPHPLGRAYVTISPCKGDFRYRFIDQPGDFSDMSCRRAVGSGSLSFGPNNANCIIDVNRRYYINIIFATVSDGINVDDDNLNIPPIENTCVPTDNWRYEPWSCDLQFAVY